MIPKTDKQKRILEISQTFPELTEKQIEYYKANCFDSIIIESRGRCVCSDCGHAWKPKEANTLNRACCPHCGHEGQVEHNRASDKQIRYFVISKAIDGYQVLRYIQVRRRSEARKVYHWHHDVGAAFFDSKGNEVECTLSRFTMSWIQDAWSFDSEIELRSAKCDVLYRLKPDAMITQSVIPVLKRNGYDGKLFYNHACRLIHALLTEPTIESWWKIGHKGAVLKCLQGQLFLSNKEALRYIRLATRHGVIFDTPESWGDFMDFINDLRYLGKDVFNPSIIFPENFEEAHYIWHERAERKREKERQRYERERRIAENNRRFEEVQKKQENNEWIEHYVSHFTSMDFERSGYRFKPLLTADDFQAEADCMNHCIRSYYGKKDTLLLSIMRSGEKVETAEIDLAHGEVIQCRGKNNHPTEHHDTIVFMLKQYMRVFKAYNEGKFLKYAKNKAKVQNAENTPENALQVA